LVAISIGIRKHIARWQREGLIDQETAERLRKDVESSRAGFGLGGVLAVLGAILLGAAIISLVAANWEEMPRLVRVVLIISVLWMGYVGGAWRESLGDTTFSQALYLIAAITFGAGIALIGQMYHLSGEAAEAALLWTGGTMVAAFLLRSKVLVAGSAAIIGLFLFFALDGGTAERFSYVWLVPVLLLIAAGLVRYTNAKVARHFIALLLITYIFVLRLDVENEHILWLAGIVGAGLFLVDALRTEALEQITGWSRAIGAYGFLMLLAALVFFQFDLFSDGVRNQVIIGFAVLACCIAGLSLSGHRNLAVRWLAYTVFSLEVLYLAFETIGTLIGTASFFLSAGVLVLLLAAFVVRMERRLQRKPPKMQGAI
jgi:uncharacterized membrane protein